MPQLQNLLRGEFFLGTETNALLFGFLNPIHLPLGAYFRFELADGAEHIKQQAASCITGIDALIEDLEVDLLAVKLIGDLSQMQG